MASDDSRPLEPTAADRFADELAARACDVLRALLPRDVAAELQAIVADQLALHPDLAPVLHRARPRAAPSESGEDAGPSAPGEAGETAHAASARPRGPA